MRNLTDRGSIPRSSTMTRRCYVPVPSTLSWEVVVDSGQGEALYFELQVSHPDEICLWLDREFPGCSAVYVPRGH